MVGLVMMKMINSGTKQWVFQRVCNFVIVVYTALFISMLATSDLNSFEAVSSLFSQTWFKVTTSICIILFALNSVMAGWQIAGDYVKVEPLNKVFNSFCFVISALTSVVVLMFFWA